ncbi:hemolysin family protein [bacterium]
MSVLSSAFFSGSETALISARRIKLEVWARQGRKNAVKALNYLNHPEQFLTTTLVGTNIALVTASSLLAFYLESYLDEFIIVCFSSLILLIFGEIIPKSLARERATAFTVRIYFVLRLVYIILFPIIWIVKTISKFILILLGAKGERVKRFFSREDLEILVRESEKSGLVAYEKRDMISRFILRGNQRVKEIMVPRTEMTMASKTTTERKLFDIFEKTGFSRLPVIGKNIDDVKGMIMAKDLILEKPFHLQKHIRDIFFIPETQTVANLLKQMQLKEISLAIVVDEYGGTAGLVTIEDVVEEFFGDIWDEYDDSSQYCRNIQKNQIDVHAIISVDELNERFALNIPEGDYQSFGGFLIKHLGHIPKRGEKVDLDTCTIVIVSTQRTRVNWVRIVRKANDEPGK